jgi:hypothetical protein
MTTVRVAIALGCLVFLFILVVHQRHRALRAHDDVDAEALEREIRLGLPLGSPLSTVEAFLSKRGIESSLDRESKVVYAVARKLKGSTIVATKSLTLRFYFGDGSKLRSVDAKVQYTGP